MSEEWRKKRRIRTKNFERGFVEQLSFQVEPNLREKLVALAYVEGSGGKYAGIARKLLTRAVTVYIAEDLTPEEQKKYRGTLENVKAGLLVSRMKRKEREKQEKEAAAKEADLSPDS